MRWSETADGVPLVTGDCEDELLDAGIVFGVGPSDETLATSGLSHLVEHLALRGLETDGVNGSVHASLTEVHIRGTRAEISGFFSEMGRRLSALPTEDLDVERRVLGAESNFRHPGRPESLEMMPIRFGWLGLGLVFETGLRLATPESATAWARRWFTASNAVCWSTGDPGNLRLGLPVGDRPTRECRPRLTDAGWVPAATSSVGLSFVTEPSRAGRLLNSLLARRVEAVLRHEQGLVYAVRPVTMPLPDCVYSLLWLPEVVTHAEAVADASLTALEELAEQGPGEAAIHDTIAHRQRFGDDPQNRIAALFDAAELRLIGQRPIDALDPPSAEAVRIQAMAARRSALVRVPRGTRVGHRLKKLETESSAPIKGRTFAGAIRCGRMPIPIGPLQRLAVSEEGVTVRALRIRRSLRFDACDGAIVQPGGEVILLGNRGNWLVVRPEKYFRRRRVTAEVLRHLPETSVVPPEPEARRVVEAAQGKLDLQTPEALAFARYLPPCEPILAFAALVSADGRRVLVATDRRTLVADVRPSGLRNISSLHHVDVRRTHLRGLAHDALVLELEEREVALTFTRTSDAAAIRTLIEACAQRARDLGDEAVDDAQNERPIAHLRYQDILRGPAALAAVTVGLGGGLVSDLGDVPRGGLVGAVAMVALLTVIGLARRGSDRDWRSAALAYSTTAPILALVLAGTLLERALGRG
jgi:zinc protease